VNVIRFTVEIKQHAFPFCDVDTKISLSRAKISLLIAMVGI
jgi:hypothetical protein